MAFWTVIFILGKFDQTKWLTNSLQKGDLERGRETETEKMETKWWAIYKKADSLLQAVTVFPHWSGLHFLCVATKVENWTWYELLASHQRCRSSLWTSDPTDYDTQSILGFLETHLPQGSSKPNKLIFYGFFTTFTVHFIFLPLSSWDWITSFYTHVDTHNVYIYIYNVHLHKTHTHIYIYIYMDTHLHAHTHTHTQIPSKSLFVCILNVFTDFLTHI